jgi:hypothetical protein
MPHLAVSVICCNAEIRSPRVVMMWAKAASTAESPSRAGPQYRPSTTTRSSSGPYAGDHVDRAAMLAADTVRHAGADGADEIVCQQTE